MYSTHFLNNLSLVKIRKRFCAYWIFWKTDTDTNEKIQVVWHEGVHRCFQKITKKGREASKLFFLWKDRKVEVRLYREISDCSLSLEISWITKKAGV